MKLKKGRNIVITTQILKDPNIMSCNLEQIEQDSTQKGRLIHYGARYDFCRLLNDFFDKHTEHNITYRVFCIGTRIDPSLISRIRDGTIEKPHQSNRAAIIERIVKIDPEFPVSDYEVKPRKRGAQKMTALEALRSLNEVEKELDLDRASHEELEKLQEAISRLQERIKGNLKI